MVDEVWQPVIYLLGEGFVCGLVVGFAARRLNKLIAALVGLLILALNVLWFTRMLRVETGFPLLEQLSDNIFRLFPFSQFDVREELRSVFLVATRVPFLVGFLLGSVVGFKLA